MRSCVVKYLSPEIEDQTVLWRGELTWPDGCHEVRFQFTCPDPTAFVPQIRPFLLTFLTSAMRLGLPIQLTTPIDQTTVHNLMEWQEALACWRPSRFKVVPILGDIAPDTLPPASKRTGAITAFSGGVDSCFTVYRHTSNPEGTTFRRAQLKAGLMVHGFDIPEDQPEAFESASRRARQILDAFGLPLFRVRTNLRTLERALDAGDWEYESHGIWLAAALSCFESFFDPLLIPSSYAYNILALPYGSTPVTDPLFASETTRLWHDGGAWNRLTKLKSMVHLPVIQEHLRVCFEGPMLDRNCGKCLKCLVTQACFWALGVPRPACFEKPGTLAELARLRLPGAQVPHLLRAVQAEARRNGVPEVAGAIRRAQIYEAAARCIKRAGRPGEWFHDL